VFFNKKVDRNGNDIYEELRPPAQYIKTKEIFSPEGDSYVYHFPIRQHIENENLFLLQMKKKK
jgi:hypothetical protein